MKTFLAIAALIVSSLAGAAAAEKPKLIVQITLDQLRADALERYAPAFSSGLKRLLDDGYWVKEGVVDHAITVSYPGHATLATGAHPSTHGMSANEWWVLREGRWTWVDAAADDREKIVGAEDRRGPSARNLLVPTLGESVKAADPAAKAISLSTGNSIAVVYGGRDSDGVYWFDSDSGRFVTSTYYRSALPPWVADINQSDLLTNKPGVWETVAGPDARRLADPDASPVENEGKNAVFPHRFETERAPDVEDDVALNRWFAGTPLKDDALVALAKRAIEAESLGGDRVVDYLSVAFDSTDSVGHSFGWRSVEYLDALLRIDRALGDLLAFLDEKVGEGAYVLALSADHGVADFPETTNHRRIRTAEIDEALDRVEKLASENANAPDLPELIARELEKSDFVAAAYTEDDLKRADGDEYAYLYRRSFRPGLTPDFPLWTAKEERPHHPARYGVIVRFVEGAIFDAAPAVHGTPYGYDRNVPIVFYGARVKAKKSDERMATVDVAPTLAELAGLSAPKNADGASAAKAIAKGR